MSQFWGGGFPRNTSNGDYGRFLFTTNQTGSGLQPAYHSTNGNRMVQHMHYPNCPNQHGNSQGGMVSQGIQDYTVEYGEDAVRAALGGNMPDFQAQFQQQYGDGGGGDAMVMNNGKSKVAMIPVVLHEDNESNQDVLSGGIAEERNGNENLSAKMGVSDVINPNESNTSQQGSNQEIQDTTATPGPVPPQQDNINNAYDSARKSRSNGQVKYGRHVRPSYINPQTPNPCRKKTNEFQGLPELPKLDQSVRSQMNVSQSSSMHNPISNELLDSSYNKNNQRMVADTGRQYMYEQGVLPPPQKSRSLPPKKHIRPTYSLCGKCQKCKNLSSEPETSVLTFPAYSPGTRRGSGNHNVTSSSNLGQSAKNFRAIRFSSNHM